MKTLVRVLSVALLCVASNVVMAGDTVPKRQAERSGIKKCLAKVEQAADFYIKDATHAAETNWNSKAPNDRLLSTFVAKSYSDGDSQINMQFAPHAGGCDTVLTETFVFESACGVVRETTYKGFKFSGEMNGKTLNLTNENETMNVYLTPAGKRNDICLVTKREVIY